MNIHVCLISQMNFDYKENEGKKAFLANSKHQYRASQRGEHDCGAHNKKMEITVGIKVYLISRMNFDYKENGAKKSFSCKSKASRSCIPIWRT